MHIAEELEQTLMRSLDRARASRHEFVTPEHFLYALTYDPVASDILHHCGADVEKIRAEVAARHRTSYEAS